MHAGRRDNARRAAPRKAPQPEAAVEHAAPSGEKPDHAETNSEIARFTREWVAVLLAAAEREQDSTVAAGLLRSCSAAHYRLLRMDEIVARYRGNLPAFLSFLSTEWRWKVSYDPATGVVLADENKAECVCPVVKNGGGKLPPSLCHCSEGFAERMFSAVAGKPVRAVVVRSILRGDPSCVYRVAT